MSKKTIIDKPITAITLRKYELPGKLRKRELVKKVCLSLGLLNPGDSRDIIVDILYVFLESKRPKTLTSIEKSVYKLRKKLNQPLQGITPSNITRQIRKLKELNIVEYKDKKYFLTENLTLYEIFETKIKRITLEPVIERVEEYLKKCDEVFEKTKHE